MKVGWGKNSLRVTKEINLPIGFVDEHVVVDAEIRVVVILMLATDLDNSSVREEGDRLPESFRRTRLERQ